jgi:hypothetical protein
LGFASKRRAEIAGGRAGSKRRAEIAGGRAGSKRLSEMIEHQRPARLLVAEITVAFTNWSPVLYRVPPGR